MRIFAVRVIVLGLVFAGSLGFACAQTPSSPAPATSAGPSAGRTAQTAASPDAHAQPASAPPAEKTPEEREKEKREKEKQIEKQEQSQRALGFYPQFAVTSRDKVPPLSPGAKFHLFFKSSFDPYEFVLAGIQSGSDQAQGEFPGYGQGLKGYGKRYAAAFGDGVSSGFWTDFFWPVVTHEDPRYFRLGHGSKIHRLGYGLEQSLVCRTDKGKGTFNFSNFLGAASSGALSNTYHPQADRGVGLTARGAGFALAYGSLGQLFNEFWPDIHEKIRKRHKKDLPPEAAPNPLP